MTKKIDIDRWVKKKIINQKQGSEIWKEVQAHNSETASNRWIGAISVVGALLLGLAAILFIGSNWEALSGGIKILLAMVITLGSLIGGWCLRYKTQTYPRIGNAILFLSMLLIGGTYALISQVYHLDGDMWRFFLLWMISVLPLAYFFESKVILRLGVILLLMTFGLFFTKSESLRVWEIFEVFASASSFLVVLILLYLIGSLHFLSNKWAEFGRTYRFVALKLILLIMFIGTFQDGFGELFIDSLRNMSLPKFWISLMLSVILLLWYGFSVKTDRREKRATLIGVGSLILFLMVSVYFYSQSGTSFRSYRMFDTAGITPWWILLAFVNAWFIAVTAALYYMGYSFKQMRLINLAILATTAYIIARYITLFMDMMSTSAFFFVGGVLLITIAVFAERKRRDIRKEINATKS